MLSIVNSLNLGDVVIILIGVVLSLKRVVEMERYHTLRVVVLTSILSFLAIYFCLAYAPINAYNNSCVINFSE